MSPDSALQSLELVAQLHHLPIDAMQLRHKFGEALDTQSLLLAAKEVGFKVKRHRLSPDRLLHIPLPAICPSVDGQFFVWARAARLDEASEDRQAPGSDDVRVLIQRPGEPP